MILTERERVVIEAVGEGLRDKEIAREGLATSAGAARVLVHRAMHKLGARTRAHAAVLLERMKVVK